MTTSIFLAAGFCGLATLLHIASIATAIVRCRARRTSLTAPAGAPPVTLIRPVCGLDNFVEETLRSSFRLDYPRYEVIFCAANARDPVVAIVKDLIAAHPQVDAKLLVGNDVVSANPKLNNCVKGWRAAAYSWIVLADSNVLMPRDYIQRLLAAWRADTGLVCSPPIGGRPQGFWAEMECAFLNTYQARWQYFADTIGMGFAQGKTMLWRRADLEHAGGIAALGTEIAEDAASTKVVRAAGLSVHLVDAPFEQPLGRRSAREVWQRQVRWARLRRASFGSYFIPEIMAGGLLPLIAVAFLAAQANLSIAGSVAAVATFWYGAEMILIRAAGWHRSALAPLHGLLRDLMLPVLWISGWIGTEFTWRGNEMSIAETRA
ncbi:MAG TPA: ceramide glucosyltransferase [Xanthobacteraceae bacterium]|jgi:ceramide glucosyltransferase|nr:ceramide glucosyltransferase [Xanthobacteraceae bacterium]